MCYIGVRGGKKRNMEKEGKNKSQHFGFLSHNMLIWRLWLLQELRNLWQKIWLERKKNGQIKRMIIWRRLILFYPIQQVNEVISNIEKWTNKENDNLEETDSLLPNTTSQWSHIKHFTKFQNVRRSSSWEMFDTNFPMCYIGVRDGKKEKEGKSTSQQLGFLSNNIPGHSQGVYNIWRLWLS